MTTDNTRMTHEISSHDKKSLSSRTKLTDRTTVSSSNESGGNIKTKKSKSSTKPNSRPSDDLNFESSSDSGYRSHQSKESDSEAFLSPKQKKKAAYARSKSEPRAARHYDYSHKYDVDQGTSRLVESTPRHERSKHIRDYSNLVRSSSRHGSRMRDRMANSGRDYSDRLLSNHRSRADEIDQIMASGGSRSTRVKKRIDNILSSGGIRSGSRLRGRKTNLSDYRDYDDVRHSDYVHGLYSRREDRHMEYAEKDWSEREKIVDLSYENEDLKEANYRLRKEADEMKKQLEEVIQTSMFFSLNNGMNSGSEKESLKKLSKNFSSLHKRNKELEEENEMMRGSLRKLKSNTNRQEEVVELLREKEEEFQIDLQEKNEIIEALEKDRESLRQFLLESQIENKIINKKTDILQKKVKHLEYETMRKHGHSKHKDAPKYLDPSDQHTVSSLED